jgi:hypothetical protein
MMSTFLKVAVVLLLVAILSGIAAGQVDSINTTSPPAKSVFPFDIWGPWPSLFFGILAIAFWIWTKPEGQKLFAVWGWIKDHARDTVWSFMAWILIWLIWIGINQYSGDMKWIEFLRDMVPNRIGPFAIPIAICSTSIINHIIGQVEERARREAAKLSAAIQP